jgi:hypothetical protein
MMIAMMMLGCNSFQSPKSLFWNLQRPARTTAIVKSTVSRTDPKPDMDEMRKEIETMREEALKRLEALNRKMQDHEAVIQEQKEKKRQDELSQQLVSPRPPLGRPLDVVSSAPVKKEYLTDEYLTSTPLPELSALEAEFAQNALDRRVDRDRRREAALATTSSPTTSVACPQRSTSSRASLALLDGTRWRLMFNLGREPGTWMPKTWGISGERLLMNLEMEFTSNPLLYDREDFLNGVSGSKVLHVVHNQLTVGPNMKEGAKQVRVKNGGWRVAAGEGPVGTDVLRFYVELEEETRHSGSDVYAPAGRLYCTCGYFAMEARGSTTCKKDEIRKLQEALSVQYQELVQEQEEDKNLVSWEKVQRAKKIMDLQAEASKLQSRMHEAKIQEPERRLLRLSRDQHVGLTREGGVCCKVPKGLAIEYQILGKFEVAAMDNREHSNYHELLP